MIFPERFLFLSQLLDSWLLFISLNQMRMKI